jgi:alkanesulfonate monooxygenase SsuD/methylene tetrahydromethanopterin reductase-like flavin-dependent oxidoreductase (luciferase family)
MQVGLLLHADRGVDAVIEEAKLADKQGFDSVWLGDHIMIPKFPLDALTLMTAIGASTERVRLVWSMLNVNFRYPAMLAKVLATLDQITKGRVVCSLGSGSSPAEHVAYNIPVQELHDDRVAYLREVVELLRELWTHPAPEMTTFKGKYVNVTDLLFVPETYQQPHPPIWIGGESLATLRVVKELADGWVTLTRDVAHPDLRSAIDQVAVETSAADWPKRPMTVVLQTRVFVANRHEDAVADAQETLSHAEAFGKVGDAFGKYGEIVGTPDECIEQLTAIEKTGANYLRLTFDTFAQQERMAELLLDRLPEVSPSS